jgi:hypothetical protein
MGPEYSYSLSPELARNWSAASHRRFSSVVAAVSFSDEAIHCMVGSVSGSDREVVHSWRGFLTKVRIRSRNPQSLDSLLVEEALGLSMWTETGTGNFARPFSADTTC